MLQLAKEKKELERKLADIEQQIAKLRETSNEKNNGIEFLKAYGFKDIEFKHANILLSDIVLLPDKARAKKWSEIFQTLPNKDQTMFPGYNMWQKRNMSTYLSGHDKSCLGWE